MNKLLSNCVIIDNNIMKSINDKRKYMTITLSNGLKCLLIEEDNNDDNISLHSFDSQPNQYDDVEIHPSAAALSVRVGSFQDPDDLNGLAHYLEHMVFMGSEEFPDENEFEAYLSKYGGYSNASTDYELTIYQVEVQPAAFHEALHRFAHFFINPLLKNNTLDRELLAVDSEFNDSLQDDDIRRWAVVTDSCEKQHVYNHFAWGNKLSLKDEPEKKDINIRQRLLDFMHRYYYAEAMVLVVCGESLEQLQHDIEIFNKIPTLSDRMKEFSHLFHDLPLTGVPSHLKSTENLCFFCLQEEHEHDDTNTDHKFFRIKPKIPYQEEYFLKELHLKPILKNYIINDVYYNGTPFINNSLRNLYLIQPIRDLQKLEIVWAIPCNESYDYTKPLDYLGNLIGHEGVGSILSVLKHQGFAIGLSAGVVDDALGYNTASWLFEVSIELTKHGLQHCRHVIDIIFAYINMLRNKPPSYEFWDEMSQLSFINFRYTEKIDNLQYVEDLSRKCQDYPCEIVLPASELYYEFNQELIESLTNLLIPSLARYDITAESLPDCLIVESKIEDRIEKWFNVSYSMYKLDNSLLNDWYHIKPEQIEYKLSFPPSNIFIPQDFPLIYSHHIVDQDIIEKNDIYELIVNRWFSIHSTIKPNCINDWPKVPINDHFTHLSSLREIDAPIPLPLNDDDDDEKSINKPLIWYSIDRHFMIPKAQANISITYTLPVENQAHYAANKVLLAALLEESLIEYTYATVLADYNHRIRMTNNGISISLNGYNDKMITILNVIIKRLANLDTYLKEHLDVFSNIKEKTVQKYSNCLVAPLEYANHIRLTFLYEYYASVEDILNSLKESSIESVSAFLKQLLLNHKIVLFSHGHLNSITCQELLNNVSNILNSNKVQNNVNNNVYNIVKIPKGRLVCHMKARNNIDKNCATQCYYQVGIGSQMIHSTTADVKLCSWSLDFPISTEFNVTYRHMLQALVSLMQEPLFDQLRTREQLGYDVSCSWRCGHEDVCALSVDVQSATYSADYLEQRIEEFLLQFRGTLLDMKPEKFYETIKSLIVDKLYPASNLHDEAQLLWDEISSGRLNFKRLEGEVIALQFITQTNMLAFFDEFILPTTIEDCFEWKHNKTTLNNLKSNSNRRYLCIKISGDDANKESSASLMTWQDLYNLRSNSSKWPIMTKPY